MSDNRTSTIPASAELVELVYPSFFAGQLLTDRDLTALEEWARARFGLVRFRDGWGVAHGLGVNGVPGKPTSLKVAPGYAVDASGNDLVLTADTEITLCKASDNLAPPCPYPTPAKKTDNSATPMTFTAGPWDLPNLDNVFVFDLLLRYKPVPSDPVTALVDKRARQCEYSRTKETAEPYFVSRSLKDLGLTPGATTAAPVDLAIQLLDDFSKAPLINVLYSAAVGSLADVDAKNPVWSEVKSWLKKRIDKDPELSSTFPTLADKIDSLGPDDLGTPWGVARLLLWMVDAARRTSDLGLENYLADFGAVPLARVWTERVGNLYMIRFLDATPPSRRPLGGGAVPDTVDSAWDHRAYIGRRWDEVVRALARLGVVAEREYFELPADAAHLKSLLDEENENESEGPLLAPNQRVIAIVSRRVHATPAMSANGSLSPEPFAERVIAFRRPSVMAVRSPVTTAETTYEVRPYKADEAKEVAPHFGSKPDDSKRLTGVTSLPSGAFVTLIVMVGKADFSAGSASKTFDYLYHDAIQNNVKDVSGTLPTASDAVVLTTIRVPDSPKEGGSVPVTLIVKEKSTIDGKTKERLLSLTDALTAWENPTLKISSQTKIGVVNSAFKPAKTPPILIVSPLAGEVAGKTPVALQGGDAPVRVKMNNDSPSPITGELRFDASVPPTEAAMSTVGTIVGKIKVPNVLKPTENPLQPRDVVAEDGFVGPVVSLSSKASGANAPFFWVVNGQDDFQRTFKIGPAVPQQFVLVQKNILVEVKNVDPGSGPKPNLKVTNNETDKITVSNVSVAADDDFNKSNDINPGGAPLDIAANASKDFGEIGATVHKRWRVWVEFTIGTGTGVFSGSGVVDVDAK